MSKQQLSYEDILEYFKAGRSIVLFTRLNTYLFSSKVNKDKEIINFLNTKRSDKRQNIMNTILTLQSYLQASETSIDVVLALFFGWVSFMLIGYLIEQRISKDEQDVQKQFDWE